MKYLLPVMLALVLTGCGPADLLNMVSIRRFKVGTCLIISLREPEEWQKNKGPDCVIREIGKHSYRAEYIFNKVSSGENFELKFGHIDEDFYQPVNCGNIK